MNSHPMGRDALPRDCFTYRGKIKVRNALRHLYDTRDLIPSDAQLCNLWATHGDAVTPKRVGRERSRLTCASGEGYRLEKTDGGKWRVVARPAGHNDAHEPADLFASAPPDPEAVSDNPADSLEEVVDRIITTRMKEEYRLLALNLIEYMETGVVQKLINYWETPATGEKT